MQIKKRHDQNRQWLPLSRIVILSVALIMPLFALASDKSCENASAAYSSAMKEQNLTSQLNQLQAINQYCSHPLVYFAIAEIYVNSEQLDKAKDALRESRKLAKQSLNQQQMLPMIAALQSKVAIKEDNLCLAKAHYNQAAMGYADKELPEWLVELDLEIETFRSEHVLSADEIRCQLEGSKAIGVVARVSLSVPFDYDSATLTQAGLTQVAELANAVQLSASSKDSVTLIGHTDSQGEVDYNLVLSLKRAQAVKGELIKHLNDLYQINVLGKGESQLVSHESTDQAHRINRRVEVVID
ncbi:OmpA family protein [Vibrio amylolyticus]|uniref:OmpA family protein n=1 Tax=Vibrio amylolyticus TaxID=2847292 RepID=UPI00354B4BA4